MLEQNSLVLQLFAANDMIVTLANECDISLTCCAKQIFMVQFQWIDSLSCRVMLVKFGLYHVDAGIISSIRISVRIQFCKHLHFFNCTSWLCHSVTVST